MIAPISFVCVFGLWKGMPREAANPVVHLELRTANLPRALGFYTRLLGWRAETVRAGAGAYVALELGGAVQGGVVECDEEPGLWLPYVRVDDVNTATERALGLGADVTLAPREGPAGWRSVLTVPDGGEVALWQPKEWRLHS